MGVGARQTCFRGWPKSGPLASAASFDASMGLRRDARWAIPTRCEPTATLASGHILAWLAVVLEYRRGPGRRPGCRPGILRARFVPRGARLMGGGKRLSRPPGTGAASRLAPRPGRRRLAERCPSSPDRRHEMSKIRWLLAPLGMALIGLAPILGATPPAWSHRLVILRHACGGRHAPRCRVGRAAAAPARPRPLGRPTRAQTRGHDPDLTGSKRSGGR